MIRNNISVFLTTKNQDDHHIVLSMLSGVLKKTKIGGRSNYLVVEPKIYFLAKHMESSTHLDHQYFIILNLSTKFPHSS